MSNCAPLKAVIDQLAWRYWEKVAVLPVVVVYQDGSLRGNVGGEKPVDVYLWNPRLVLHAIVPVPQ